jgi:hypothetical protein
MLDIFFFHHLFAYFCEACLEGLEEAKCFRLSPVETPRDVEERVQEEDCALNRVKRFRFLGNYFVKAQLD